jgi:glycosyltransferase involved in cell wall biosynthesis
MSEPFFSVLIPTKNRSEIVGDAVRSVLNQTFGDFEIILSDNDDSDSATRDKIVEIQDPRLRYIRTSGKLPMHDNWENALVHARGRNVLVVEDKQRLVSNALEILHGLLRETPDCPISYRIKFVREASLEGPNRTPTAEICSTVAMADAFCRFSPWLFERLPKGLDSCVPRRLAMDIKANSPTGMFFSYINPDYASAFQILAAVPRLVHVPAALIYVPNNWGWSGGYSNGQSSYKKNDAIKRFFSLCPIPTTEIVKKVPLKCEYLWINAVLFDFLTLYKRNGGPAKVDWARYHAYCGELILMGRKLGADMSAEIGEMRRSLGEAGWGFRIRVFSFFVNRLLRLALLATKASIRGRGIKIKQH